MATYTLKGSRFIRKYTSHVLTPAYAASDDASAIAEELCNVPWEEIGAEKISVFPNHNSNSLDLNVTARDYFDACNFCANHADGMHRAYANVACYRLALPSGASGLTLSSLKVRVSCDPYCRDGARVAIHTNSTGVVPTACSDCRAGLAHAAGVAPRTVSEDGKTWYGATATCTITPESPITLGSYLYVFITLETPSYSRDAWLEGAAKAVNSFEVELSGVIDGYDDGATIDSSRDDSDYMAVNEMGPFLGWNNGYGGQYSCRMFSSYSLHGIRGMTDDNMGGIGAIRVDMMGPGIAGIYRDLYTGNMAMPASGTIVPLNRLGDKLPCVCFAIREASCGHDSRAYHDILNFLHQSGYKGQNEYFSGDVRERFELSVGVAVQHVILPRNRRISNVRLECVQDITIAQSDDETIPASTTPDGSPGAVYNLWLMRDMLVDNCDGWIKNPSIYDARDRNVAGWELVGQIPADTAATSFEFRLDTPLVGRFATLMLSAWMPPDRITMGSYWDSSVYKLVTGSFDDCHDSSHHDVDGPFTRQEARVIGAGRDACFDVLEFSDGEDETLDCLETAHSSKYSSSWTPRVVIF